MYICLDCGEVFEVCDTYEEARPYGMGYAYETFAICPHCKSDNFTEAVECERCGEIVAEEDCCVGDEFEDLCKNCYEELYG